MNVDVEVKLVCVCAVYNAQCTPIRRIRALPDPVISYAELSNLARKRGHYTLTNTLTPTTFFLHSPHLFDRKTGISTEFMIHFINFDLLILIGPETEKNLCIPCEMTFVQIHLLLLLYSFGRKIWASSVRETRNNSKPSSPNTNPILNIRKQIWYLWLWMYVCFNAMDKSMVYEYSQPTARTTAVKTAARIVVLSVAFR